MTSGWGVAQDADIREEGFQPPELGIADVDRGEGGMLALEQSQSIHAPTSNGGHSSPAIFQSKALNGVDPAGEPEQAITPLSPEIPLHPLEMLDESFSFLKSFDPKYTSLMSDFNEDVERHEDEDNPFITEDDISHPSEMEAIESTRLVAESITLPNAPIHSPTLSLNQCTQIVSNDDDDFLRSLVNSDWDHLQEVMSRN